MQRQRKIQRGKKYKCKDKEKTREGNCADMSADWDLLYKCIKADIPFAIFSMFLKSIGFMQLKYANPDCHFYHAMIINSSNHSFSICKPV